MGFHLEKDEPVGLGVQRILTEQATRLSEDLTSASSDLEKAIHEVRKRCKRVRAVLRLVRPHAKALHRRENAVFRDMARRLSPLRDADVRLKTFDDLVSDKAETERFAPLRDLLLDRETEKPVEEQISQTAKEVHDAKERLEEADISNGATFKLIRPGLRYSYKLGRRAMSDAYGKSEEATFHEWRKRVKDLGYQMQILRESWPAVLKRLRSELDKLGDLLGKDHDLAVVRNTVVKKADSGINKDDLQAFLVLAEHCKGEIQAEAQVIGRRIYAEKPGDFVRRICVYWETWKEEVPAPAEC
jgi:CHAD domain-containing protein